jgi:hypothetical protein
MSQFSPTVTSSTGEGFSLRPRKAAFPASLSRIPSLNYISYWCISLKSSLRKHKYTKVYANLRHLCLNHH